MSGEGFLLRQELKDETKRQERLARIEELETRVFEQASQILMAVLDFAHVSPHQTEPPPEWIEQFGEDAARKRLEMAKSGWLPQSIAPNGTKLASQFVVGSMKGRQRNQRLGIGTVNVKLSLPAPTSRQHPGGVQYPVKDLDE